MHKPEPARPTPPVAPVRAATFLRRTAGVVALGVGFCLATGIRVGLMSAPPLSAQGASPAGDRAVAPDTVLRHPNPARPLPERWEWARGEARRLGSRAVWIGYNVRSSLLVDLHGLALPGVRLSQLVGASERSDALALLFRFAPGLPPVLARVHAGSFSVPLDLGGEPLIWLGVAEDGASLARLQALFAEAPTIDLKQYLVTAVGLHGSSEAVVPLLDRWTAGGEPRRVRAQAADWLKHHGRPRWSVPASGGDGGREAARLIAFAQDIPDPSARELLERARRQP